MLLALDTATPAVTVAVAEGDRVLAERTTIDARRHGELLAPAIEAVLADAGIDRDALTAIAVGTGPGPFTGLRVGLVTARMLGSVLGIPVLGVCTLDAIALHAIPLVEIPLVEIPLVEIPSWSLPDDAVGAARDGVEFRVVTDARRREVHWAAYRLFEGVVHRTEGPYVEAPATARYDGVSLGAGAALYSENFPGHREPLHPRAGDLAAWVAHDLPTSEPVPLYLRRPDAMEPAARKR